jgi:hypothetical protein
MNVKPRFWACSIAGWIAAVCFSAMPLAAQTTFDEERDIALWVLRL